MSEHRHAELRGIGHAGPILRVVGAYAAFAILWILASDIVLRGLVPDLDRFQQYEMLKGVGFVVISSLLILFLLQREHRLRELAEEQRRREERRYREMFEATAAGMAQTDPATTNLVRVNPAYCHLTGYSESELVGESYLRLVHPEDREADRAAFFELVRGERPVVFRDKRYIRKDGSILWVQSTVTVLRDSRGIPQQAVAVIVDMTAQRTMELALRQTQDDLRQAKEDAENASRAKDHFLAVLSHELRTPLTPAIAALSVLDQDASVPETLREEIAMVRRNVELEARLIDDLLDLTRVARGKILLDRRPTPLAAVIEQVVQICAADIDTRGLHFAADLKDQATLVDVDPARMQQVFWNLLKNAIKFTPQGGCIGMKMWKEQDQLVVEVHDSGRGIAPGLLPRLFSAFEQGGLDVTRQFGGLGLGLSICKALVEMHGGTITAQSAGPGQGASFCVRLPVLARTDQPRPQPSSTTRSRRPGHEPLNVLLVEDHGDTARVLKRALSAHGHHVETAGDVASALDSVKREQFDVLVSDLGLPDRSGLELVQELRTDGYRIPAIAMSGYGQEEDIVRSRAAGFVEHLTKPVDIHRLEDAIERVARQEPP